MQAVGGVICGGWLRRPVATAKRVAGGWLAGGWRVVGGWLDCPRQTHSDDVSQNHSDL